ncbi:MAG TPA: hypothetical protein VFX37_05905 [Pseudolabrys sp.]|nr:hypothetical protein [Pseudolabrys sp.]
MTVQTWSNWKRFPTTQSGDAIDAPAGPGVYEVRHMMTGRLIAFGHAANAARAIAELNADGGRRSWMKFFRASIAPLPRLSDLEYRICPAASRAEAKTAARRLMGLRQTAWRRRMDLGWALRAPQ